MAQKLHSTPRMSRKELCPAVPCGDRTQYPGKVVLLRIATIRRCVLATVRCVPKQIFADALFVLHVTRQQLCQAQPLVRALMPCSCGWVQDASGGLLIVDRVVIPEGTPAGEYVLGWRAFHKLAIMFVLLLLLLLTQWVCPSAVAAVADPREADRTQCFVAQAGIVRNRTRCASVCVSLCLSAL